MPADTEALLEFVSAKTAIVSFTCQHTKSDQAASHMVPLRPLRPCLTARQDELSCVDANHFFKVVPDAIQPAHLGGRQRQPVGGLILGAVSDGQGFQASCAPAAGGLIGVAPIQPKRLPVEAAMLPEPADKLLTIVVNPL
jgi:hypothetical protein